jgi:HD-GYP domain-containing protein (c-di-GMP phosphodiesterase class II)
MCGITAATITYFILEQLKLPDKEGRWTLEAALLHDIGVLDLSWGIRQRWLIKPGTMLYDEDWDEIMEHPQYGYQKVLK